MWVSLNGNEIRESTTLFCSIVELALISDSHDESLIIRVSLSLWQTATMAIPAVGDSAAVSHSPTAELIEQHNGRSSSEPINTTNKIGAVWTGNYFIWFHILNLHQKVSGRRFYGGNRSRHLEVPNGKLCSSASFWCFSKVCSHRQMCLKWSI